MAAPAAEAQDDQPRDPARSGPELVSGDVGHFGPGFETSGVSTRSWVARRSARGSDRLNPSPAASIAAAVNAE
jgi:hypothetical protein